MRVRRARQTWSRLDRGGKGSAAVAELPLNRYATGGAINDRVRQIGAVLGISTLIVLLGTPTPANADYLFHRAWALMALTAAIAAVTALALGRLWPAHRRGDLREHQHDHILRRCAEGHV